jgi:hypothetical protein
MSDKKKKDPALAATLPGRKRKAEVVDDNKPAGNASATAPSRTATYPPARWDKEDAVISSAMPRQEAYGDDAGAATSDGAKRIPESQARAILNARFHTAGAALEPDYAFRSRDLIVHLDGYDPARSLGYAYLSHGDADVVTDFDEATEMAFEQLAREGKAFVLIVHDVDVPSIDALESRIDGFFTQMQAATEDTQQF